MGTSQRLDSVLHWLIALLLVLGLVDLIYAFTGDTARFGNLYPAAHVLLNIVGFLALSFIYSKERWAGWLFIAVVLLELGLDYVVGAFHPAKFFLLVPALFFLWLLHRKSSSAT